MRTSKLVKSTAELFDSERTICFMKGNVEMNMAIRSPKGTILSRLFYGRTKIEEDNQELRNLVGQDRCLLNYESSTIFELQRQGLLLVLTQIEGKLRRKLYRYNNQLTMWLPMFLANAHMIAYAELRFFDKVWVLTKAIQEYSTVVYFSNSKRNQIVADKM